MRSVARALVLTALVYGLSPAASAEVYTIGPGSVLQLSGDVKIEIGILSGHGPFVAQPLNGLDSVLTGTIVASASGGTLNFPGGSQIKPTNSGTWLPSGVPGAFGFTAHVEIDGLPGAFVDLVGNIRDLEFDVLGTTPLSGPPDNQTFNPAGLELKTVSGLVDVEVTACSDPTTCDTQLLPASPLGGPPNDTLLQGPGTLATAGNVYTLSLPLGVSTSDMETDPGQGVPVTVTLISTLTGPIVAVAAVPEPSTWAAFLIGLALIGVRPILRSSARRL